MVFFSMVSDIPTACGSVLARPPTCCSVGLCREHTEPECDALRKVTQYHQQLWVLLKYRRRTKDDIPNQKKEIRTSALYYCASSLNGSISCTRSEEGWYGSVLQKLLEEKKNVSRHWHFSPTESSKEVRNFLYRGIFISGGFSRGRIRQRDTVGGKRGDGRGISVKTF